MRLFVFFLVAVVWLQLSIEGDAWLQQQGVKDILLMKRQLYDLNSDESEENLDLSAMVKAEFAELFRHRVWKTAMIYFATENDLKDPDFIAKWDVTDEKIKSIKQTNDISSLDEQVQELINFYNNPENRQMFKGMIALSSPRADLMDPEYRAKWGLGENIPSSVVESQDDDNFFVGPQFNEFMTVTDQWKDFDSSWSERRKLKFLRNWYLKVYRKLKNIEN